MTTASPQSRSPVASPLHSTFPPALLSLICIAEVRANAVLTPLSHEPRKPLTDSAVVTYTLYAHALPLLLLRSPLASVSCAPAFPPYSALYSSHSETPSPNPHIAFDPSPRTVIFRTFPALRRFYDLSMHPTTASSPLHSVHVSVSASASNTVSFRCATVHIVIVLYAPSASVYLHLRLHPRRVSASAVHYSFIVSRSPPRLACNVNTSVNTHVA